MDIIEIKTSDLRPYVNNPRDNAEAVDKVAASIEAFGFKVPLVVDADNVIVTGHTRWLAAQKLGLSVVPCLRADDLSPEQVKAFRLADNKVSEFAKWDKKLLREELKALQSLDLDMTDFGFTYKDIKEVKEDNYKGELPENPSAQRGDVYKLGDHLLVCGDATEAEDYSLLLGSDKVDLVLTDPPYNVNYQGMAGHTREKIKNDFMADEAFLSFISACFLNMFNSMKDGASLYSFCASLSLPQFRAGVENAGLTYYQILIWVKNQLVLGRMKYQMQYEPVLFCSKGAKVGSWYGDRKQRSVIESIDLMDEFQLRQFVKDQWEGTDIVRCPKPIASKLHPTMKPIKLLEIFLRNSSAPGDIVLDPFGGSGSTLIACEQMGRKCRTMELEPAYVDVIIDRWQLLTGKVAEQLK